MLSTNVWDHIDDALPIIEKARQGNWVWMSNTDCKYIELRIDMRDGGCIIRNRLGERITPQELARQFSDQFHGGQGWPARS